MLEVMKRYIDNDITCLSGCVALSILVEDSCKYLGTLLLFKQRNSGEGQARAREAGGIEVVLDAMKRHIDSDEICSNGCETLHCLVKNSCK